MSRLTKKVDNEWEYELLTDEKIEKFKDVENEKRRSEKVND